MSNKIQHFCTYLDKNYLTRGLALFESLQTTTNSHLWVLATDKTSAEILIALKMPRLHVIPLVQFEDDDLRRVKPNRKPDEYMWTMTPSLPLFIFNNNPNLELISYIDADCYFFSDPSPIFNELDNNSVGIIEHRFAPKHQHRQEKSGIYNVGMVVFKRDVNGLATLQWWRQKCIEWCYRRYEDGKMGDQMYLNDWPKLFSNVHVIQHKGAGLAPWNVERYQLGHQDKNIYVDEQALIFYHYHGLKLLGHHKFEDAHGYTITKKQHDLIYEPYFKALNSAYQKVLSVSPSFKETFSTSPVPVTRKTKLLNMLKVW